MVWLQTGGPATAAPFNPVRAPLAYSLPEFGVFVPFGPTEFTQVNHAVNGVLVRRAMALLAPAPGERVADFFCGLGNFTLPLASRARKALAIEGSEALVRRARAAAALNGLSDRTDFSAANLFGWSLDDWQRLVARTAGSRAS